MNGKKRRRNGAVLLCLFVYIWGIPSAAAGGREKNTGRIEIQLTNGAAGTSRENVKFAYAKVGTVDNGRVVLLDKYKKSGVDFANVMYAEDLEKAAGAIQKYVKNRSLVSTNREGQAFIENLEEGVYLLELYDKSRYEPVMPMLVTVPMWSEEEKQMSYEITVIPKHGPEQKTPKTNDDIDGRIAVAAILSCHTLFLMIKYKHKRNKGGT